MTQIGFPLNYYGQQTAFRVQETATKRLSWMSFGCFFQWRAHPMWPSTVVCWLKCCHDVANFGSTARDPLKLRRLPPPVNVWGPFVISWKTKPMNWNEPRRRAVIYSPQQQSTMKWFLLCNGYAVNLSNQIMARQRNNTARYFWWSAF